MLLDMQLSLLQLVLTVVLLSVQVESLWELLCPLIRTALSNITIETYADWGTCIATACVSFRHFVLCISFHVFTSCRSPVFPHDSCVVQESRDPRKLHWLFEMLMESPVNGEGGSFVDAWWVERLLPGADINVGDSVRLTLLLLLCSRLYVLQGGLAQQEWRVSELLHRLLQYLEPKLTQVYKNVRERIGR